MKEIINKLNKIYNEMKIRLKKDKILFSISSSSLSNGVLEKKYSLKMINLKCL